MSRRHEPHRDRSRDRHGYRGRSQSPPDVQQLQSQSNQKRRKAHHHSSSRNSQSSRPDSKRVKFNDVPDIKVFRKEDEPNTKGLTDGDIQEYMKKIEAEKGSNVFASSNWEKMKHFDAQLQNNSIKQVHIIEIQQKQRQKILNEKLQGIKEQIAFYTPLVLRLENLGIGEPGEGSSERSALSDRLNDVLGCFYVQQSQIPSEPSFQIQNKSTSVAPKHISFDKQRIDNKDLTNTNSIFQFNQEKVQKKDQKPLKGILKLTPEERARERSASAPRRIDPSLINLLKQMQINKAAYPKERAEILLKPYKDSGQLDYLKNNPNVLTQLMRGASISNSVQRIVPVPTPIPSVPNVPQQKPASLIDPYKPRYSVSPQVDRPPMTYPTQPTSSDMTKPMGNREYQIDPNLSQPTAYNPNYPPRYYQQQGYTNFRQPQPQPMYPYDPSPIRSIPQPQSQPMMYPQSSNPNPYPSQPSYGYQQQQQQSQYMANRNYKTVPCKYFHRYDISFICSPQGCVKAVGCTFIHDQQYAGRPTPSMLKPSRGGMPNSYGQGDGQQGYYQGYAGDYQRQ